MQDAWSRTHPAWSPATGRLVRGRALRLPVPAGPEPQWALHLLRRRPPAVPWPSRWLRWPDFRLPADAAETSWQRTYVARWRR